jgi:hypothetical protein
MSDLRKVYNKEIVECLVKYGNLTNTEANNMVQYSEILDNVGELLFHEYPYYWAMHLLYGKLNNYWFHNSQLWPPPDDYLNQQNIQRGN